jgi:hypothetical protein
MRIMRMQAMLTSLMAAWWAVRRVAGWEACLGRTS